MARYNLFYCISLGKAYTANDLEEILQISRSNVFKTITKAEKAKDFKIERKKEQGTLFYVFQEYKEV